MRLDPAVSLDRRPRPPEEEWIPARPAPAPGKRSRTARLVAAPQVAEEPPRPAEEQRRPRGEAGGGSFMPPVRELVLAGEEEQPVEPEVAGEEEEEEAPEPEENDLDPDLEVGDVCELGLDPPAPTELDPVAMEADLESAVAAVEEPHGPEGARVRLERVAGLAGARRREAQGEIDAENAALDLEEEAVDQRSSGRRQEGATLLAGKRQRKTEEAQSTHAGRLLTRAASRDELKQELVTAQAGEKQRAADVLSGQMVELETRLAGQLAVLMEEQKSQDEQIAAEFAVKNADLAVLIEEKKTAHQQQIGREKIALEVQAANEKITARAEAARQAGDITASADAQAAYTLTEAQLHAGNVEAKASREAQKAIDAGEVKAQQAVAAAEDRAVTAGADESEKASIRAEGEMRASQARLQAAVRASEIRSDGTGEAAGIRDKGKVDSDAEKTRGQRESAAAVERGEAAARRIEDELAAGVATMQLQSAMAVAEMENERALAMLELEQARALALTRMATELTLACVKIEQERTAVVTALHLEHDNLVAAIDVKIAAAQARVDAASDKDLAVLQRRVERDLAAIDRQVKKAERRMQAQVDSAEARVKADVARRRVEIRKAGRAVLRAIDGVVAKAEGAIARADQDTSQEISDAAVIGVQSIAAESQEARDDNRTASETAIREQEAEAMAARAETSTLATDASQAMEEDRKALDGEIDQRWVDDALARSGALLSRDGTDWAVSDEESVEAMHLMASLPPHLQGQVIDNLSDDQFEDLLSEMDDERHEHLEPLVMASTDPYRKLEMWQHFQLSRAEQDAARNGDDYSATIAETTEEEIEEEVELLEKKMKAGEELTYEEVQELVARKKLENEIEMKFRVNLTAEKDDEETEGIDERFRASGPHAGTRIAWTATELVQVQSTLEQLPYEHIGGNTSLRELHREDVDHDGAGNPEPGTGGCHHRGTVNIYDTGTDPASNFRHNGDPREPYANSMLGANLGTVEVVLAHEIGHNIHDANPILWEAFQQAAGWETRMEAAELIDRGLSPVDLYDMIANGVPKYQDGKVYNYRYGQLVAFDNGAIPQSGQPSAMTGVPRDTWDYARNNQMDHFAETYMKAVMGPEQLARDLLDKPARAVAAETGVRDVAMVRRDAAKSRVALLNGASPPTPLPDLLKAYQDWMDSEADLGIAQEDLDEVTRDAKGMAAQYTIMRDGVFRTGEAVAAAQAELEAAGVSPTQVADFLKKAARVATPHQVDELKKNYV